MSHNTTIEAFPKQQDLRITRQFNLSASDVFKAHTEVKLIEEWMNTKVLHLEPVTNGSWHYLTSGQHGFTLELRGTFHSIVPDQTIVRTFELNPSPFGVQLEFLNFSAISKSASLLEMHILYQSVEVRDQVLKTPFKSGLSMAHDRLENLFK